ncbi:sema domain, immunoglobulin domain (Ig), short basic domain, secreted, (semaphorin) 3F isoform X2 [Xenopus tropicalis]|uniref:sema domain, immunoglobulin domain (Ig), short basic domain, secreted, (semaphorin) 3F isoform X2 n=1 Tax=Xenopus tropicalis TaxID=8364 RepID=UPI00064CFD1A|nr:sema domain, immunoglobulin domain (Ig), short basic domain, secreted, (semaphorin) 3F isoform X2 [Xenopus tropicalis]|eukprot:XP_012823712.1 PREDICTED: sema domain, immunoglobulin domain (Ig), short basic domain, secreted, (semaphorin) 3F isoform X2 [Xenopus tropicalis]
MAGDTMLVSALPPLLLLLLNLPPCVRTTRPPRVYLSYRDLMESRSARSFTFGFNTSDYRILLLDQDQDRMYVGSRDYVLSLDLGNINREPLIIHWPAPLNRHKECLMAGRGRVDECYNYLRVIQPLNRTHLYACGTGAYQPQCAVIYRGWRSEDYVFRIVPASLESGKGRCPYDPKQENMATLIDGVLYAGVQVDYMGTDSAIFRTMGHKPPIRTEQYDSRWLNDPLFVGSLVVSESSFKEDDKLYILFRERSLEGENGPALVSRIARVCLNDEGGLRSLVGKWTSYLKARLVCSVIGQDGVETSFDQLRDVFIQPTHDKQNPLIYGVFTTLGSVFRGSAVCVYSLADVRAVFNGPFAHKEGHGYQMTAYSGKTPYPRPGACAGGFSVPRNRSSRNFGEDVLRFVRTHPLMYSSVYPVNRRPLLLLSDASYTYTSIAVDRVPAADGEYTVLFLGTDRGTVQKVMILPRGTKETESITLEEVEVFKVPSPIRNLRISSKRHQLYVSSDVGVTQLSLHRCGRYGDSCADCCLARDPYCAWDGKGCVRYTPSPSRRSRRQDVKHGDPLRQCRGYNTQDRGIAERLQISVEGGSAYLQCDTHSPLESVTWLLQRDGSQHRREVRLSAIDGGAVLRSVQASDAGVYTCTGTENGFRRSRAKIRLNVLPRDLLEKLTAAPTLAPMAAQCPPPRRPRPRPSHTDRN